LFLDTGKVGNLFVENVERGVSSDDTLKDLGGHPVEGVLLLLNLLVLIIGTCSHGVEFLGENFVEGLA
jgi:hypothetical protein